MRRTSPPEPSAYQAHSHEWHVHQNPDAVIVEDGAIHITEGCEWVEVTGASHSERHDETFYSYGAECDATRSHRFDIVGVEKDGEKVLCGERLIDATEETLTEDLGLADPLDLEAKIMGDDDIYAKIMDSVGYEDIDNEIVFRFEWTATDEYEPSEWVIRAERTDTRVRE